MSARARSSRLCLVFVVLMWSFGTAWSQTCMGICNDQRCTDQPGCTTTYEICLGNAGGDPDAEALCLQQRDACFTAVDDAFATSASTCTTDPCVQFNCGPDHGYRLSLCNDQNFVCRMLGGSEEDCNAQLAACQAGAVDRYHRCLLNVCTTTCTVNLETIDWGAVKQLYRE